MLQNQLQNPIPLTGATGGSNTVLHPCNVWLIAFVIASIFTLFFVCVFEFSVFFSFLTGLFLFIFNFYCDHSSLSRLWLCSPLFSVSNSSACIMYTPLFLSHSSSVHLQIALVIVCSSPPFVNFLCSLVSPLEKIQLRKLRALFSGLGPETFLLSESLQFATTFLYRAPNVVSTPIRSRQLNPNWLWR